MANIFDLQTTAQSNTGSATHHFNIGGAIPAGKTRFLTYVRIEKNAQKALNTGVSGITCLIAGVEYSNASGTEISASSRAKLPLYVQGVNMSSDSAPAGMPNESWMKEIPDNPDITHPLIAVTGGASSWMAVQIYSGAASRFFAVYYDE